MTDYEIVPATTLHVGPLMSRAGSQALRVERRLSLSPRRLLRWHLGQSREAVTALIGDRPVAMWGVMGGELSVDGQPWLVISDEIRHRRFVIVREAKRYLRRWLETHQTLTTLMEPDHACSLQFARFLGFDLLDGVTIEVPGMTYLVARLSR